MLISLVRISRNSSQILRVLEHDFISKEIVKSTVRGGWGNQGEEKGCFWKKEGGGHKVLCPPAQIQYIAEGWWSLIFLGEWVQ